MKLSETLPAVAPIYLAAVNLGIYESLRLTGAMSSIRMYDVLIAFPIYWKEKREY